MTRAQEMVQEAMQRRKKLTATGLDLLGGEETKEALWLLIEYLWDVPPAEWHADIHWAVVHMLWKRKGLRNDLSKYGDLAVGHRLAGGRAPLRGAIGELGRA